MNRLWVRLLVASLALVFALGSYLYARHAASNGIEVRDAWVRATPPGAEVAAAYLEVINHGAEAVQLLGISSDAAESTELHSMTMENGMMQMRQLDAGVSLAPGATASFAPGATHVMLIGLKHALQPGATVQLTLQFAGRPAQQVAAQVRAP